MKANQWVNAIRRMLLATFPAARFAVSYDSWCGEASVEWVDGPSEGYVRETLSQFDTTWRSIRVRRTISYVFACRLVKRVAAAKGIARPPCVVHTAPGSVEQWDVDLKYCANHPVPFLWNSEMRLLAEDRRYLA